MNSLKDMIYKEWILGMVQKQIFCPINDNYVLDIRTCVVVLDPDGDPTMVMSPEGWAELVALVNGDESKVLAEGYTRMVR